MAFLKRVKKQAGSAIIVALFAVALIAGLTTAMMREQALMIERTQTLQNLQQAYLYGLTGKDEAINYLREWQQQAPTKRYQQIWPHVMTQHIQPNVTIRTHIIDAESRFNLTNLNDPKDRVSKTIFLQLIKHLLPTVGREQREAWLNQLSEPLTSISFLRELPGVTAKRFKKLAPYLIVLPQKAKININSASMPLIMSLSSNINSDQVLEFIQQRQGQRFKSVADFDKFSVIGAAGVPNEAINVESHTFLLIMNVQIGRQMLKLFSLIEIKTREHGQLTITTLRQSWNTF